MTQQSLPAHYIGIEIEKQQNAADLARVKSLESFISPALFHETYEEPEQWKFLTGEEEDPAMEMQKEAANAAADLLMQMMEDK